MTIEAMPGTKRGEYPNQTADWLITCDELNCKDSLDAKDRIFGQAVVYLKAKGWQIRHLHKTFLHYCPEHRKDYNAPPSTPYETL